MSLEDLGDLERRKGVRVSKGLGLRVWDLGFGELGSARGYEGIMEGEMETTTYSLGVGT